MARFLVGSWVSELRLCGNGCVWAEVSNLRIFVNSSWERFHVCYITHLSTPSTLQGSCAYDVGKMISSEELLREVATPKSHHLIIHWQILFHFIDFEVLLACSRGNQWTIVHVIKALDSSQPDEKPFRANERDLKSVLIHKGNMLSAPCQALTSSASDENRQPKYSWIIRPSRKRALCRLFAWMNTQELRSLLSKSA